MKQRPILFNGEMVRAILDGRKTITRRVIKPQPQEVVDGIGCHRRSDRRVDKPWLWTSGREECYPEGEWFACPYGQPGDLLWVRETFQICSSYHADCRDNAPPFSDGRPTRHISDPDYPYWEQCYYAASDPCPELLDVDTDDVLCRWRPSIHMPKWAARIWLEVKAVHVERVQDISDADAKAEGAFFTDYGRNCGHGGGPWRDVGDCPAPENTHPQRNGWAMVPTTSDAQCLGAPRWAFANLWERINAARGYGWDENPWVWVVEFERTGGPSQQ